MAQFYVLLTQTGQAKMANALALGTTIDITEMAVGDGGGVMPVPDSDREELVNEVRRAPVNRIEVDSKNPNWLIVEQVLPPDIGGWTIREVGLFDADGDLIGYGNYPETYKPTLDQGSGRTLTIRMVLEVSHTAAVTLKVDPAVVLATREYVDDQLTEHEQSRNHPAATTEEKGLVEKATTTEAEEGAENKFPDAAGVLAAIRANPYIAKVIAEPFPVWDHLAGVEAPSNLGSVQYIKLTAGEDGSGQYNEGLLTNETVSGSGPLIEITAEIATGPLAGEVVSLINSENRYLMPGESSGAVDNDQMQRITGFMQNFENSSTAVHSIRNVSGAFQRGNIGSNVPSTLATGEAYGSSLSFDSSGSSDARTGDSTNVKHAQATYYMRIA